MKEYFLLLNSRLKNPKSSSQDKATFWGGEMIARQNRRRKIPLLQSYKNDSHWFHISHSVSYGGPCISLMIGKLKIQSDWKQRRQITQSNLESSVDVEENSNPNQSSPDPYSLISGIANLLKLIEDGQRHLLM